MSWGLSYQIGMAEQAANSVLPVSGAGGLALGVWALRCGGMSTERGTRGDVQSCRLLAAGGVLVLGYLIGQLGGNLPLPGGIGSVNAGLIGIFALYHQPLAPTTAAVLVYHAIALWIPAPPGSVAFVQLRRRLTREAHPAAICTPLVEPRSPSGSARGRPQPLQSGRWR